jgi:hypothetical protein
MPRQQATITYTGINTANYPLPKMGEPWEITLENGRVTKVVKGTPARCKYRRYHVPRKWSAESGECTCSRWWMTG